MLRDHYFISWLKVTKGYSVILSNGKIFIDINKSEYDDALLEYERDMKPVLKEIRRSVKQLSAYSSKYDYNSHTKNKKIFPGE